MGIQWGSDVTIVGGDGPGSPFYAGSSACIMLYNIYATIYNIYKPYISLYHPTG